MEDGLTNSNLSREEIFGWLRDQFNDDFINQLHVYGSFLLNCHAASDVDVLVIYSFGHSLEAAIRRREVERMFGVAFGIPLHAIFLSDREMKEEAEFLSLLLVSSLQLR